MVEHAGPTSVPAPPRKKRASKGRVRALAWTASGLSFLGAFLSLTVSPKPAEGAVPSSGKVARTRRPVVVVVTKKIVYAAATKPAPPSGGSGVQYVYAPAAPAAPPVATSCGSTPC